MATIKKYLRIVQIIIIAIILFYSFATSQSSYYYYGGGMQRSLYLSSEIVTVKFLPSLTFDDIESFILSEPALDLNKEPEPMFYEFYVLYVLPGNDIEELIQRLRSRQEVSNANPVYLTESSTVHM